MNSVGEPTSLKPVPKMYEASHGMCRTCGILWLQKAIHDTEEQPALVVVPVMSEVNRYC